MVVKCGKCGSDDVILMTRIDVAFKFDKHGDVKLFTGMAVAKRIQSPPVLAVTNRTYDPFAESQNVSHLTQAYKNLQEKILVD